MYGAQGTHAWAEGVCMGGGGADVAVPAEMQAAPSLAHRPQPYSPASLCAGSAPVLTRLMSMGSPPHSMTSEAKAADLHPAAGEDVRELHTRCVAVWTS